MPRRAHNCLRWFTASGRFARWGQPGSKLRLRARSTPRPDAVRSAPRCEGGQRADACENDGERPRSSSTRAATVCGGQFGPAVDHRRREHAGRDAVRQSLGASDHRLQLSRPEVNLDTTVRHYLEYAVELAGQVGRRVCEVGAELLRTTGQLRLESVWP